ncbi:MAG: nucleoside-diphosphate sugar epimerase/dehydratase [Bacteroidota bacterium]|nr:nucleoside-diphosphate sugar epimerase/dehydratase [Bacteroidota bacterium]
MSMKHRWWMLFLDVVLCLISFEITVILHNRYQIRDILPNEELELGMIYLLSLMIVFYLSKTYRGLTRHMQFLEIGRLSLTVFIPSLIVFVTLLLSYQLLYPALFAFSLFITSLILLMFVRYWIIMLYNYSATYSGKKQRRTLIYGIGAHSIALSQWIAKSAGRSYRVLGFVTRDDKVNKMHIQGLPVFNLSSKKNYFDVFKKDVDVLLFPDYRTARNEQEFLSDCLRNGFEVLVSPPFEGVEENGRLTFQMKPIQFEDLLGRDEIVINLELIGQQLNDKVILVTGAAGSIGSEIARQLARFKPKRLILLDVAETPLHQLRLDLKEEFPDLKFVPVIGDVRIAARLDFVFRTYKPTVVYHAAAYKHVPLMEENPCEAVLDNVMGSKNLADFAVKYQVERFVMISTDKAVNPTNVMGASKRIAEIYIQSLAKECAKKELPISFVTTRFGNVLGSNGSVIPHFKDQIEHGGPVTVTHPDIIRYFMTIPEACRLVLEAASFGNSGEIYVFDMGQPVKIVDLARRMIELAGLVPERDIKIEFIGLRPGEKLYEELLSNKEETIPTSHEKIMVAKVREYDFAQVSEAILAMIDIAKKVEVMETVRAMKRLVPEFHSKNSPFEQLD